MIKYHKIGRKTALFLVAVMLLVFLLPADSARAGLFDHSWFDSEGTDLYYDHNGFEKITPVERPGWGETEAVEGFSKSESRKALNYFVTMWSLLHGNSSKIEDSHTSGMEAPMQGTSLYGYLQKMRGNNNNNNNEEGGGNSFEKMQQEQDARAVPYLERYCDTLADFLNYIGPVAYTLYSVESSIDQYNGKKKTSAEQAIIFNEMKEIIDDIDVEMSAGWKSDLEKLAEDVDDSYVKDYIECRFFGTGYSIGFSGEKYESYGWFAEQLRSGDLSGLEEYCQRLIDSYNNLLDEMEVIEEQNEEYLNIIGSGAEDPGLVEKGISGLVRNSATGIRKMLAENGISFDGIVYGRVNIGGDIAHANNYFSFELEKDNVYGIMGAAVYATMRDLLILAVMVGFIYYLMKASFSNSARTLQQVKSNIGFVILALCLLYAMPNLVDLVIHLRDVVLKGLADGFGTDFAVFGSLEENYLEAAEDSKTFLTAAEYFGMVIMSIYFAFVYISMACSMLIMFAFFPLVVVMSFRNRKLLDEWITFTIGVIITPLIDAVLMLVPLLGTRLMSDQSSLLTLILCLSIIPSRGVVKKMLGVSSSVGAELLGVGTMLMAGRAAANVVGTAKRTVGGAVQGASAAKGDFTAAKVHAGAGNFRKAEMEDITKKNEQYKSGISSIANSVADDTSPYAGGKSLAPGGAGLTPGGSLRTGVGPAGGAAMMSDEEKEMYKKNANINNFESDLFRGKLDDETMAELYRQRGKRTVAQTIMRTAGSAAGGTAGAAMGFSAGMFMGPQAAMMGGAAGMNAGSALGDFAGKQVGTAASASKRGVNKLKNRMSGTGTAAVTDTGTLPEYVYSEQVKNASTASERFNLMQSDEFRNEIMTRLDEADAYGADIEDLDSEEFAVAADMRAQVYMEVARILGSGTNDNFDVAAETAYIPPKSSVGVFNDYHQRLRAQCVDNIERNRALSQAYSNATVKRKGQDKYATDGYVGREFNEMYEAYKKVQGSTPTSAPLPKRNRSNHFQADDAEYTDDGAYDYLNNQPVITPDMV